MAMTADEAMKALVGRTIADVVSTDGERSDEGDICSYWVVTCTDGYSVELGIDYEDTDVYVDVLVQA